MGKSLGEGRPGWHMSVPMSMKYLGPTLDIHAGGIDLIFPHHENEIAQSEAATGKPFARFFLHNGYVNIDQEKMSKSLGNIVTVRELTQKYEPSVLRLAIFSAHYRSPINLDENLLQSSRQFEERIKNFLRNIGFIEEKIKDNSALLKEDKEEYHKIDDSPGAFKRLWLTILTLLKLWEYWENSSAFSTSIFLLVGESGMCKRWKKLKIFLKW